MGPVMFSGQTYFKTNKQTYFSSTSPQVAWNLSISKCVPKLKRIKQIRTTNICFKKATDCVAHKPSLSSTAAHWENTGRAYLSMWMKQELILCLVTRLEEGEGGGTRPGASFHCSGSQAGWETQWVIFPLTPHHQVQAGDQYPPKGTIV